MTRHALESALGRSLDPVRAALGSEVVTWTPNSPLPAGGSARAAYRVGLADGRSVKLRRLREPSQGRLIAGWLAELNDAHFARILLHHEDLLVEEWIDGVPLIADASLARELAGALDPGATVAGLCHGDFCAENMLLATDGRLRVIDNESLAVAPIDRDVARTFVRWPMSAAVREAFLDGYAARRDPATALRHERFWRLCVSVRSAHLRAVRKRMDATAALAEIAALLEPTGRPANRFPEDAGASSV